MRLRDHLRQLGMSTAEARKALQNGKVFLCGIPSADGGRDIEPSEVEVRPEAARLTPGRDLVIVYRDADVVVVWKPSGLLSVPARKTDGHRNVVGLVRKLIGAGLAVHRIDQPTSGLMMVARNETAQQALKAQLEVHSVERRYLALVSGRPSADAWTVDNHLTVDRGDGRRGSIRQRADTKHAVTHFRVVASHPRGVVLVGARLETGRTHQVRIHLSEGRLPILGDSVYAPVAVTRAAPRLALHAAVLGFKHPRSGKDMRFEAPLPDDLSQLLRELAHPNAHAKLNAKRGTKPGKKAGKKPRKTRRR
jgi:23S rRNA pseudouridine1911/1915/1917 synthase